MSVNEAEFNRVIGNLLRMPPKKHADSKLGTRKTQRTIIPPRTEGQAEKPDSEKSKA